MVFSRLASIPTNTLVGVAAFGGMATALFGLHTRKSIQTEWARKPFYQDAIKALRWSMIHKRGIHSCSPFIYRAIKCYKDSKDLQFAI